MQVTETLSEGLKRSYAVTVPAAELESRAKTKLAGLSKDIRLPGFRPGKVPANLVRARYGTSVMAEVMQEALDEAPGKLVEERNLRPAGQPKISLVGQPRPDAGAQDLAFTVEMHLLPEIALPELSALSLVRRKAVPADEAVQEALARIAENNRAIEDVTETRGAQKGELLVVDFTGSIDGVPFEGGSGGDVTVEVAGDGFIPGFTEQLEGLAPGETRTIEVTFPAEYHAPAVAGKAAQFVVTAKALKHRQPAGLDDALASRLGFENLEKLREVVIGSLQQEYDQLSRLRLKRELLDALAEKADFPAPENLLETEFDAIWQRVEADRREGRVDEEDAGKDEATLRAEYRAIADRRVRLGLLLAEIGRVNNVQVTQAELTQALRQEASRYPGQEMQVLQFFQANPGAIEQLRGPLFEDKVVDHILGVAAVTEEIVTPDELNLPPVPPALAAGAAEAASAEPAPAEAEA